MIKFGAWSCIMACIGEFAVEIYAASQLEDYDSFCQTISYLGHTDSSLNGSMTFWGAVFTLLFVFFAMGFGKAFKHFRSVGLAVAFILIYGIAQGIRAAYFSMNISGQDPNAFWDLHNLSSGLGDIALVLFPFVMLRLFWSGDKKARRKTAFIAWCGLLFVCLFLGAKYFPETGLGDYKGLLQRVFQLVYYSYFVFIALMMLKSTKKGKKVGKAFRPLRDLVYPSTIHIVDDVLLYSKNNPDYSLRTATKVAVGPIITYYF